MGMFKYSWAQEIGIAAVVTVTVVTVMLLHFPLLNPL